MPDEVEQLRAELAAAKAKLAALQAAPPTASSGPSEEPTAQDDSLTKEAIALAERAKVAGLRPLKVAAVTYLNMLNKWLGNIEEGEIPKKEAPVKPKAEKPQAKKPRG